MKQILSIEVKKIRGCAVRKSRAEVFKGLWIAKPRTLMLDSKHPEARQETFYTKTNLVQEIAKKG